MDICYDSISFLDQAKEGLRDALPASPFVLCQLGPYLIKSDFFLHVHEASRINGYGNAKSG